MEFLEAEGHAELRDWLHFSNDEAEPKALIRLLVGLTREGVGIGEQPGVTLFLEGRWTRGGPSEATGKSLAQLSPILGVPIHLIYKDHPDHGEYHKLTFGGTRSPDE